MIQEIFGYDAPGCMHRFTGKERDIETGLDYFGARYYGSNMARFTSVDPVIVTPERLRDPQQLNLYSYVRNNPLRYIDPTGETLRVSGDLNSAMGSLCEQIGQKAGCSQVTYDDKTKTITVDFGGIDLSKNEGAALLSQVIGSQNVYDLSMGASVQTAGGSRSVESPLNLDRNSDIRFGKGKTAMDLPAAGIDGQVALNPAVQFRDSQGRLVPLSNLVFHELAEAYAKVDGGKQYVDFSTIFDLKGTLLIGPPQQGAHNEAVRRELKWRLNTPSIQNTGRAGDVLIRDPK